MSKPELSISLVLGSGGARGHAHIGVIRAIEERGLHIRNIAGSSMGAVIGGIYASDKLDTYVDWANRLERKDIVRLLDFSFTWTSLFKGERIFEVLEELVGDRQIEDLDIGYTAVATDLDEQREVWLCRGSLFNAMRASTAVPGFFTPIIHNGHALVDGGLISPIPIAPTLNDSTDLTIAVNLSGITNNYHPKTKGGPKAPSKPDDSYRNEITRFIGGLFEKEDQQAPTSDATEILTKSIDTISTDPKSKFNHLNQPIMKPFKKHALCIKPCLFICICSIFISVSTKAQNDPLQLKYFGTAGWEISDGKITC